MPGLLNFVVVSFSITRERRDQKDLGWRRAMARQAGASRSRWMRPKLPSLTSLHQTPYLDPPRFKAILVPHTGKAPDALVARAQPYDDHTSPRSSWHLPRGSAWHGILRAIISRQVTSTDFPVATQLRHLRAATVNHIFTCPIVVRHTPPSWQQSVHVPTAPVARAMSLL